MEDGGGGGGGVIYIIYLSLHCQLVSRFGLAGKLKGLGLIPLRLSFLFEKVVCGHCLVTLKWLSSQPILMQESFWWIAKREKRPAVLQWCQNSDLTCRKTAKRVHKLATGAGKNWIFFAVDNLYQIFQSIGRLWLVNPRQLHLARAVRAP